MMKDAKILVVGSLNMDITATTHIFPAEGETVLGDRLSEAPGGKGLNQACQIGRLGGNVKMVGALGNDDSGKALVAALKASGVDTEDILIKDGVTTGTAIVLLEVDEKGNGANRIIVIPGANLSFNYEDIAFLEKMIKEFAIIILQLEIPMSVNEKIAALAKKNGIKVMLNPAPYAPLSDELLRNIDFLSPNEHELQALTGIDVRRDDGSYSKDKIKEAFMLLHARGLKALLITLGESGSVYIDEDKFLEVAAIKTIAVDTTAAGDSFVSSFSYRIAQGDDILKAMTFATKVAAYTVSHLGASSSLPRLADLD